MINKEKFGGTGMDSSKAQQITAETGKMLLEQGLVARTWGNISCRIDETHYAITPSGLDYVGMTPVDIVIMDLTTGKWDGLRKPSGERGIHSAAYQLYSDVTFAIHTHQTYATAIGLAGFEILQMTPEEKEQLEGVELAEYGLPGTKKLTNNVKKALALGAKVVLIANHGALICGSNREESFQKAVLLEQICKRNIKGQSDVKVEEMSGLAKQLIEEVQNKYQYAKLVRTSATLQLANTSIRLKSQVDDMAQMIGSYLKRTEANPKKILKVLEKTDAVLIPGIGAIVKAQQEDDVKAMAILIEKAAVCYLHTEALNAKVGLSWLDSRLMRVVYKMKYSKQK